MPFGILNLDPNRALQSLGLAHDEGECVAAEVLQCVPVGDDAGVTGHNDLRGAVLADDGLDAWKGQDLPVDVVPMNFLPLRV